jgi:hypothetical protein
VPSILRMRSRLASTTSRESYGRSAAVGTVGRASRDKDLALAFGGNRTVKVVIPRNPIIDYLRKTRGDRSEPNEGR